MKLGYFSDYNISPVRTVESDAFSMTNVDNDDVFSTKTLDDDVISVDGEVFVNDFSADQADKDEENTAEDLRQKRKSSSNEHIQTFVQEDKLLKEIEDAGSLHGLNNYINKQLEWWEQKKINIAVAGNSGSGKSSLINAIRGLRPKSYGAAPVGIKETTTKIQSYKFPENDHVVLFDLPGVGTARFKRETYIDDTGLSKFDIVIIVTATRLFENDVWLAVQALSLGKSVLFVRTKIDFDLTNASRDDPDDFDAAGCIATIRRDIEEHVHSCGISDLSDGIYLVSSPDRANHDFPILIRKLKSLLNNRGIAICRLLMQHLEKALREKRDAVKRDFTCKKVASAVYGFLPVPKLETALNKRTVAKIREVCLERFNLDDDSLHKVSKEVDISVDTLKRSHLTAFNTEQLNNIEKLCSQTEEIRFSKFQRYSKYFVPLVGSVMSACKVPHTIQDCVDIICSIMAENEFHLVQLRLEKLERQLRPL